MFEPAPASGRRPLYGVSVAAHVALAAALVVPPLLATPEPPDRDGFVRIESVPRSASVIQVMRREVFLGKGHAGGAPTRLSRATNALPAARPRPTQPNGVRELLPLPIGEQPSSPLEEIDEQSESGYPAGGGEDGTSGSGGAGCEGCSVISATAPGVAPPVAIETIAPAYPELARRAHVEGVVILEAIIGADGSVHDVRVLRGTSPLLDPAALEAVRRWRYRPARIGDRNVAVFLNVVVTFALRNL
jgi:protein TonB